MRMLVNASYMLAHARAMHMQAHAYTLTAHCRMHPHVRLQKGRHGALA